VRKGPGVLAVALLSACAAVSSPASAGQSQADSTPDVEFRCPDVPLRAPDGQVVFLSGRWIGAGDPNAVPRPSVFLIRQTNSCMVWVGLSAEEGEALGASWIETFSGQVRPDFTIVGLWDEVPEGRRGVITVGVEFVPAGSMSGVELQLRDSTGDIHEIKRWVREDTSN